LAHVIWLVFGPASEVGWREIELICPTGSVPLAGTPLTVLLVGGLLVVNPFSLGDLILADRSPGAALGLLLFGFVVTFGSLCSAARQLVRLLRRNTRQRPSVAQFHVKINRIDVESVRPGWRAHFDKGTRKVIGHLQWFDHRPAFGEDVRKIARAFVAVRKANPQTMTVESPQAQHVNHGYLIRLHLDQRPFPAEGAHAHVSNYPAIRPVALEPIAGPSASRSEATRRK
jgi:hypothetical protein